MGQFNLSVKNPWLKIFKDDGFIAECDRDAFPGNLSAAQYAKEINKDAGIELTFSCLPDPFCGNPLSKVYCLNLNPGRPDQSFSDEEAYKNAAIKNLRLEQDTCFWAENIRNKGGKQHDGVGWIAKRTKELEGILGQHPDIFFIEYFPYHSSKGFEFPERLPSYNFTDALIKKAIEDKKLIIIMRGKKDWLKRIKDLKKYHNLYSLKCAQGGYLTINNIVRKENITENTIRKYFNL